MVTAAYVDTPVRMGGKRVFPDRTPPILCLGQDCLKVICDFLPNDSFAFRSTCSELSRATGRTTSLPRPFATVQWMVWAYGQGCPLLSLVSAAAAC
ncbi:MAG: hypothetical protein VXX04_00885, partial [Actinomycetota bacterium]|nr:hypothetical protein [Actinomycetota bacterium]